MATEKRLFDIHLELLNNELKSIDGAIRQQDEITKSVKNWAVVTWAASIGVALKEPELHAFVWLTAIVPLVFWLVDGSFRRIQRSFIARVEEISTYFNSESFQSAATTGVAVRCSVFHGQCESLFSAAKRRLSEVLGVSRTV